MKNIIFFTFILLLILSCSRENFFTDREGNTYEYVSIGEQTWMADNLNVTTFANGDTIFHAQTESQWEHAGKNKIPAWCSYNNIGSKVQDKDEITSYGNLYNWFAVNDPRGLAPEGWRVANEEDWNILNDYIGKTNANKLKNKNAWGDENNNDDYGFNLKPGGYRNYVGKFEEFGKYGAWWSSTEKSDENAFYRYLIIENNLLNKLDFGKEDGMSVRCVKN